MKINQQGQALLELTIATGLALMVVTALTITTIIGLRNSQFAQNQLQATKLAQEGLEIVRTIRDRDYTVCLEIDNVYKWSDLRNKNFSTPRSLVIEKNVSSCPLGAGINTSPLWLKSTPTPEIIGNFKREIFIQGNSSLNKNIQITSRVSWTDFSGTHKSELVTKLSTI